ncbi:MAG: hypothetical protein BGO70_01195 [Bacteroidetes bacterium 43-93]|uniref:hypothetical protein n=1 Tax=uncultured Dysgonomonas sp. TaxID=206096 RepID=UPI000928F131|nr:hypothetical protein [uncultured Dysgonomonas sp.]MBN9483108.1 hypothetical protein [Bacteroidota bacterium]OJW96328.1 MAG: hypothetical protein BGO70_01195 [Bacteroidetes bacterium 43-93]
MSTRRISIANTGLVNIATANSNLNGTGSLGTVLTAANDGTLITSITVKATQSTTEGMVRLFIYDGVNTNLYQEIPVPASARIAETTAFEYTLNQNLFLDSGYELRASTQNSESFNVLAVGANWINCNCDGNCCTTNAYGTANTGMVNISTANSNLDGTGSLGTAITAPNPTNADCTQITTVTIKATQSTSQGMVRLFIDTQTSGVFLFREIPIPAVVQNATNPAYATTVLLNLNLQPTYKLRASTENAESFNVIANSVDYTSCPC